MKSNFNNRYIIIWILIQIFVNSNKIVLLIDLYDISSPLSHWSTATGGIIEIDDKITQKLGGIFFGKKWGV